MNTLRTLALGSFVVALGAVSTLPAAAQGFGFGIEIGPRYERPYHYYHPYGYGHPNGYGPTYPGSCYYDSLNGRVCVD